MARRAPARGKAPDAAIHATLHPMISGFLQSWTMFQESYWTALLSALALSMLGVAVVARGQVFLAAAVSQAATLGAAVALLFNWSQPALGTVGCGLAAALFAGGTRGDRRGREEATAWVFLVAASLSVLVVAREAMGMKQVQALLASSLIGAGWSDVLVFAVLAAGIGAGSVLWRGRLVLLLSDPVMAAAVGMRTRAWSLGIAAVLGLTAGLSIRGAGLLFTFGCLALPPLIARNVCRTTGAMFWAAPLAAVLATAAGLVVAHRFDFPPGQVVVAGLGLGLAGAWAWAGMRQRLAA